jgi:hypothetical protein
MPYDYVSPTIGGVTKKILTYKRSDDVHTQVVQQESATPYVNLDLDETGVSVTVVESFLQSWHIFNRGTTTLYVKVYDKATAATNGDTPKLVFEVAPGIGEPYSDAAVNGYYFALGISLRCTTGIAHNDTGAPGANDCLIDLGYRSA